MSVTPSFVRAAQTTPTKDPLDAIDAFAFARPATPISIAVRLRVLAGPAVMIQASSPTPTIPLNVTGILTEFSSPRLRR
jgi:hypothetical protein